MLAILFFLVQNNQRKIKRKKIKMTVKGQDQRLAKVYI